MTIEHLIAFNLALIVAVASPGPAFLVAVQTSLSQGRMAGIAVGCGLALMASLWTGMALLGLEAVFRLSPWAYGAVKIVGAAYLLYIAWQIWNHADAPLSAELEPARRTFRRGFMIQGFMINVLNPKSVLFAAAVLVVIFPSDMSLAASSIVVVNHFVVEVAFYSALAAIISTPAVRDRYLGVKAWLDGAAALVLGTLGLRLLINR
jgi:threonine/homoserine/homoserine lactone efflux protein